MSNPNRHLTPEQRAEARRQGFPLGTDSYRNLMRDASTMGDGIRPTKVNHLPAHGEREAMLDRAATAFLRRKGVKLAHERGFTNRDKRSVVGDAIDYEATTATPGTTLLRGGKGGTHRMALMAQGK